VRTLLVEPFFSTARTGAAARLSALHRPDRGEKPAAARTGRVTLPGVRSTRRERARLRRRPRGASRGSSRCAWHAEASRAARPRLPREPRCSPCASPSLLSFLYCAVPARTGSPGSGRAGIRGFLAARPDRRSRRPSRTPSRQGREPSLPGAARAEDPFAVWCGCSGTSSSRFPRPGLLLEPPRPEAQAVLWTFSSGSPEARRVRHAGAFSGTTGAPSRLDGGGFQRRCGRTRRPTPRSPGRSGVLHQHLAREFGRVGPPSRRPHACARKSCATGTLRRPSTRRPRDGNPPRRSGRGRPCLSEIRQPVPPRFRAVHRPLLAALFGHLTRASSGRARAGAGEARRRRCTIVVLCPSHKS